MAELGPPFGGITRIRFKGFVYDVSAIRLPRTNFFKVRPGLIKSIAVISWCVFIISPGSKERADHFALHGVCAGRRFLRSQEHAKAISLAGRERAGAVLSDRIDAHIAQRRLPG